MSTAIDQVHVLLKLIFFAGVIFYVNILMHVLLQ